MSQAMLWESLRAPGAGFYVQQLVVELDGPLSVERLRRAWHDIAARHLLLRASVGTSFQHLHGGAPRQCFRPEAAIHK